MPLMMTRPGIIVSGVYLSASFEVVLIIHRWKDVIFKSMDKVLRRIWLGFWYNDCFTAIPETSDYIENKTSCREDTNNHERDIQVLGMIIAMKPAILPAPIHNRHLKRTKSFYLSSGFPLTILFLWLRTFNQTWSGDFKRPVSCYSQHLHF